MPFTALGLLPPLAQAAADAGFHQPTPVQQQAIAVALSGADLLVTAQTGSGKTAAYALALLQRLITHPPPASPGARQLRALVLVPTRELAAQVGQTLRHLARHLPQRLKIVVAFGGVSVNPQLLSLRGGAEVVVATPGRLLDLMAHNALRLSAVECLVLDEADRLLDLGFSDELQRVLAALPGRRQNLFFSATLAPATQALAGPLLHDPQRIDLTASTEATPTVVVQRAIAVDARQRTRLLRQLITEQHWQQVLVFVATQYAADHLATKLHRGQVFATSFHGGLSQGARQQALQEFKERRWDVLVTTDLAARGLHIDQLPVVVNHDLPRSAVDYVHRIGRTGRAGASGLVVNLVTAQQRAHWQLIQKRQGLSLPLEVLPGFEPTDEPPAPPPPGAEQGGIKGRRPSKKDKLRAAAAESAAAAAADQMPAA
jgi:ATP-dependent RNA helicase RhlE